MTVVRRILLTALFVVALVTPGCQSTPKESAPAAEQRINGKRVIRIVLLPAQTGSRLHRKAMLLEDGSVVAPDGSPLTLGAVDKSVIEREKSKY